MKQISSSVGDVDAAAGTKGTSVQSDAGEDNIAQGEPNNPFYLLNQCERVGALTRSA